MDFDLRAASKHAYPRPWTPEKPLRNIIQRSFIVKLAIAEY